MFDNLDEGRLEAALEALLFISDEPRSAAALASMVEVERATVERVLAELAARFEREGRGIQLLNVAGGWRLYTHPDFGDLLQRYVLSWDTRRMTDAALEVLAIVAYGQPLTRAQIAAVRGVSSDSTLNTLIDRGLVREAGTLDAPGAPTLYATSRTFLERFGLSSPADLPPLEQFAPDEKAVALIKERLGAVGAFVSARALDTTKGATPGLYEVSDEGPEEPSLFDVVDKIDFDALEFDTDDE
ncbi:SMC-Scp complex subunit ScpB [Berryella wangjianweii]|uniref:SMC-Scp complex subunit ScpB n=1 Tax=Berryella wangjianweii TaxID=2734634 RepID=A0A6M8IVZ2_9ACTN|nr:SMC-Scp complex subunit ScpB [Berryella wangjianweii]NPD32468.1 SMC-Scp complex subunit ScpB [Eggerthellaceae bacterium zg-997]QKF06775.1 SMC-Scp complex subunit ScpB [Berryella wangjianweii]